MPALDQSHKEDSIPARTLAVQWQRTYDKGATQNPPIAIGIATVLSYLAWSADSTVRFGLASPRQLYAASVVLTMGIVPWTLMIMAGTNGALHRKAAKATSTKKGTDSWSTSDDEEVSSLLSTWILLNGVRSFLPLLGFASGAIAALA